MPETTETVSGSEGATIRIQSGVWFSRPAVQVFSRTVVPHEDFEDEVQVESADVLLSPSAARALAAFLIDAADAAARLDPDS